MKTLLAAMKQRNSQIPEDTLALFETIVKRYSGHQREGLFLKAMEEFLTREQRFRLFERHGNAAPG